MFLDLLRRFGYVPVFAYGESTRTLWGVPGSVGWLSPGGGRSSSRRNVQTSRAGRGRDLSESCGFGRTANSVRLSLFAGCYALPDGVMVTHQVLVLAFQVRVLVG